MHTFHVILMYVILMYEGTSFHIFWDVMTQIWYIFAGHLISIHTESLSSEPKAGECLYWPSVEAENILVIFLCHF